jgi:hypothetical protein
MEINLKMPRSISIIQIFRENNLFWRPAIKIFTFAQNYYIILITTYHLLRVDADISNGAKEPGILHEYRVFFMEKIINNMRI